MCQKYSYKNRTLPFLSLESRDTGLSVHVYLNKMVIKLPVLLGFKVINAKAAWTLMGLKKISTQLPNKEGFIQCSECHCHVTSFQLFHYQQCYGEHTHTISISYPFRGMWTNRKKSLGIQFYVFCVYRVIVIVLWIFWSEKKMSTFHARCDFEKHELTN